MIWPFLRLLKSANASTPIFRVLSTTGLAPFSLLVTRSEKAVLTCRYPLVLALATLSEICPIAAAWALLRSLVVSIEAKIDMRRTHASCKDIYRPQQQTKK